MCMINKIIIILDQTAVVIAEAKKIKTVGATGAYTTEFKSMEEKLNSINEMIRNASISTKIVEDLEEFVADLRYIFVMKMTVLENKHFLKTNLF